MLRFCRKNSDIDDGDDGDDGDDCDDHEDGYVDNNNNIQTQSDVRVLPSGYSFDVVGVVG